MGEGGVEMREVEREQEEKEKGKEKRRKEDMRKSTVCLAKPHKSFP